MVRKFQCAIVILIALGLPGFVIAAGPLKMFQDERLKGSGGLVIDSLGIDVTRYTGWISVLDMRSVVFDLDFDEDSGTSVTAVKMTCQTSRSGLTANGAGRDIHVLTTASGVSTSVPHTWSNATSGDESWTWMVTNIPGPYLQCAFSATGVVVSADKLNAFARGITP